MIWKTLFLAVFTAAVSRVYGCISGGGVDPGNLPTIPTLAPVTLFPPKEPIKEMVGDFVTGDPYDPSLYENSDGGPVESGAELNCNFENACCWDDQPPLTHGELRWLIGSGFVDMIKISAVFGPFPFGKPVTPTGKFLFVGTHGTDAYQEARFVSCEISCAQTDITVTARHWSSKNAILEVCQDIDNQLENCQPLPRTSSPGPTTVTLPPEAGAIVFVARNLIATDGVILDDIVVDYEPCPKEIIKELVGDEVESNTYDPTDFINSNGGPVESGDELNCNFDSSCCWDDQPFTHGEQLSWTVGTGPVDREKIENNFGQSVLPNGKFLFVGSHGAPADDEAQFVSCSIECTNSEVSVTARHWTTPLAILEVCQQIDGLLVNCQKLERSRSPGPTTLTFPAEAGPIVFVARNLVSTDAAIIDDIVVDYEPCSQIEDCEMVTCNFEDDDACGYVDASITGNPPGFSTGFEVVQGRYKNFLTGVRWAPGRDRYGYYTATYLRAGDKAATLTNEVDMRQDRVIRFKHFEATAGMEMRACCDKVNNCPFTTNPFAQVSDRKWHTSSFMCPAGTNSVIFICENKGSNQGACALDDIQMFVSEPGVDPDDANELVCE